MKPIHLIFAVVITAAPALACADDRPTFREQVWLNSDRPALLQGWIETMRGKTPAELATVAANAEADRDDRIGAAVLLLRDFPSPEGVEAALSAIHLEVVPGVDEWESAGNWMLRFPVAAEVAKEPGLMPEVVGLAVKGLMPDRASRWILVTYLTAGHDPRPLLRAALEGDLSADFTERVENMLELLEPRRPAPPPAEIHPENQQSPQYLPHHLQDPARPDLHPDRRLVDPLAIDRELLNHLAISDRAQD